MKVMITGITGTLGRAFIRLLSAEHQLFGIDHNEERVSRLNRKYPNIPIRVGDFDELIFNQPLDLLIHLAAMKHVDLCETNPSACISNNVVKTYNLFRRAYEAKVDILFMSTDKAVEPNSIYGYSKALIEGLVKEYGGAFARSGNIVASNGSVLRIWDDAIVNQEPLKITHKDMRRYFVKPNNLAKRIWEQYAEGVEEIIPEMDMDIKLVDLAIQKLARYGYTLEDYPGGIEYVGLRPGEKLTEKMDWT